MKEALQLSARLRLPTSIPFHEVGALFPASLPQTFPMHLSILNFAHPLGNSELSLLTGTVRLLCMLW